MHIRIMLIDIIHVWIILKSPIYFYKVIWKRNRELVNTYLREPILGNKIQLEEYEIREEEIV